MFLTDQQAELPIPDGLASLGERLWWHVKKKLHIHWFHVVCEVTYEKDETMSEMIFTEQIDHLLELEKNPMVNIEEIDLVSPGFMNGTKRWQMEPLSEIITATQIEDQFKNEVNIFVLKNGKRYMDSGMLVNEQHIIEPRVIFKVNEVPDNTSPEQHEKI